MDIGSSSPHRLTAGQIVGDFSLRFTLGVGREPAVWAREHGFLLEGGVLDRGRSAGWPTVVRECAGDLGTQRARAEEWRARLVRDGFRVVRTCIEAAPWNEGVPRTDAEAAAFPCRWFAHRVTVRAAIPYEAGRLVRAAGGCSARLSRLARAVPARGVQERLVVQRAPGVGRQGARARLEELLAALGAVGFRAVDVEEAYVVHDDGPAAAP
ncbi:hypothetical protein [Streptomyces montanisoli]|uniref:Uncharacterized protein n=1 Tax=Streptomyces montanisoli TaxID=2798581 RepID=A0A940RY94_9ACTN|nr:hypothetical protein [Streptomyces montanisoli]MBP0458948.1 hypothetical protein [Streptomyces montanisoli]